ncbi:class I SAM-dependent methyltransferase [Nonomuraea sp. 10N515B]|uniref:class I SAM-dependent methyltransferase n=1 Tax=Nonomuraea sp. 10N515B TaxID=3457422 RepID=UPI003FCD3E7C
MSWAAYLRAFHEERAGITEEVLRRCRNRGGEDPYRWLLAALPQRGLVLDLACGSAPLSADLAAGHRVVGVDAAFAELQAAPRHRRMGLVLGDARALPVATACVDVVVCSMALMVLTPVSEVLAEIRRVLRPQGMLAATVPATGPLRATDLPPVAGLVATLGRRLGYPGDRPLGRAPELFARSGLRVVGDERRRFGYPLRGPRDADLLLESLYLPGLPASRRRWARRYLRLLTMAEWEMPVPVRRILAVAS